MSLGSWEHHGDLKLARDNEMELVQLVLFGQGQNIHLSGALGTAHVFCVSQHPRLCVAMPSRKHMECALFKDRTMVQPTGFFCVCSSS